MTDASFMAAGYAVLIEDDPLEEYTSPKEAFAPVAYGSKTFSPTELKINIYALLYSLHSKILDMCFTGPQKPEIFLTDNKTKKIRPRSGMRVIL